MKKIVADSLLPRWLIIIIVLLLSALACASLSPTPSPVQTVAPTETELPPLPTADSSSSSSNPDATLPVTTSESTSTALGEDIPIAGVDHIQEGTTATDWNSDPPTSGQHYGSWAPAGFYEDAIADGYLVHNMEHGYVIIYYNCDAMTSMDCTTFKTAIETAMAAAGTDPNTQTVKIIAVPRPSMDNPITYASWGHLYKAVSFAPEELILYVQTYRSNADYAPEASLP